MSSSSSPSSPSSPSSLQYSFLLFFLLLWVRSSSTAAAALAPPQLSAYEVLRSYGLPVGLLPKGATGYDLDPATGDFTVRFDSTCSFSLESYKIRYKPRVSGRISDRRLSNLDGVSVKILFLWIGIAEVTRTADQLEFSVGIASADFPIDNFDVIPQCGCGLDCVGAAAADDRIASL